MAAHTRHGIAEATMADDNSWLDLEAQFRALSQSALGLRADWNYVSGSGEAADWCLTGSDVEPRLRFENLARRAGASIPKSESADSLQAWLDLLMKRSPNFQ